MSKGGWETPLGRTPIDNELAQILLEVDHATKKPSILESEEAHQGEHSLEVQLPFLQFLTEDSSLRIVPLVISTPSYMVCERVGKLVAKAITQAGRDVTFLASTDFTHYGKHFYNYAPVGTGPVEKIVQWVHETDGDLIKKIEQMDGKALLDTVIQEKRTMCGASAVATMLVAASELGATSGELLKYATSYDIRGSSDAIVGYASISIQR